MLKPQENPSRALTCLNGLWRFVRDAEGVGRTAEWWRAPLKAARQIAVPASYNDLFPDAEFRDHVGDVWYQRDIFVPRAWAGERVVLRFDAATHRAVVWLDDHEVMRHEGGYTPFEADISDLVSPGASHRLTVCVNNELHWHTIPPGRIITGPDGRRRQQVFHDFFNYAGLHRSVWLYTTPASYIADATIVTDFENGLGKINWSVEVASEGSLRLTLRDADGVVVASDAGSTVGGRASGEIAVANATPWQPGQGYLYALDIAYTHSASVDRFTVAVGLRRVRIVGRQLRINDAPFYFKGFGKHEDSAIRGKAHDDALMVHDFALLDWIGANSFRTAHYPYAEEVLDFADRAGIVVIDETAAVGINMEVGAILTGARDLPAELYSPEAISDRTQQNHSAAIRELIARDKNHPCVVLWSIANEPDLRPAGARAYFAPLIAEAKRLDPSRPVTSVNVGFNDVTQDCIADLVDVICLNRYYGWYSQGGDIDAAEAMLRADLASWVAAYDKPIIVTEFGADTMPGLHAVVPQMWTEEYQRDLLAMHHRVFDEFPAVIGEHVWNFADFATSQGIVRVGGNKKGVFTRDRQPKAAAHLLRARWTAAG